MSFIKNIPLRPHHGMCLAYFKGEGYSNRFSAHMQEMLDIFQKGAKIQLHADTASCRYRRDLFCMSE